MNYANPTANRAIGSVNREWSRMTVLAYQYRMDPDSFERRKIPITAFTGIYARLLTDPIEELKTEVLKQKQRKEKRRIR